jgi:hypothetical protein
MTITLSQEIFMLKVTSSYNMETESISDKKAIRIVLYRRRCQLHRRHRIEQKTADSKHEHRHRIDIDKIDDKQSIPNRR